MGKNSKNPWAKGGELYPYDVLDNNWKSAISDIKNKYSEEINGSSERINTGNTITINGKNITINDIKARHLKIKSKITTEQLQKLTNQEKLILDLPIIMANIGWLYSSYCQLHWLEASGDTVEVPYDFPVQYQRTKDEINTMKANLKQAKYASIDEYNNLVKFSLDGSASYLLYDFDIDSCQKAYYKAVTFLKTIEDYENHTFGNWNFNESIPKLNLIRSYTIGSKFGDLDDLGGSFGRFSLRVYIKGLVKDQDFANSDWLKYFLNISEIGFRFIDEFNFNDAQDLGSWKHDVINSELPKRYTTPEGWIKLANSDYQKLVNRKIGIGKDFILQSELRFLTNDTLKTSKDIVFFFSV